MALKLKTPPLTEPLTLTEAKAHLRVTDTAEDTLINSLIVAAREYCENFTSRVFITQTWVLYLDSWPERDEILLPFGNLQSVASVQYTDSTGVVTTWDASNYVVDTASDPGRVVLAYGKSWPSVILHPVNPIAIEFTAGYGDATKVPQSIKHAMLLLIGHWYANREAVLVGSTSKEIEFAVSSLLYPYRLWRW